MSYHKPLSIRICTKKTEIQDVSITNLTIKVLNLSSLTSAIIRSDGRLDKKIILFFENFFGEAPITFSRFFDGSLVLGFADGSLVIFHKCPSKSLLLENYKRIPATLTSSPIKTAFLPFLTVHKTGNCYEFVNLNEKTILTVPELKEFLFIEEELKIIFITIDGSVCIYNLSHEEDSNISDSSSGNSSDNSGGNSSGNMNNMNNTSNMINRNNVKILTCTNIKNAINSRLLKVNNDWIVSCIENIILIINIETEEIISSFIINFTISDIHLISSNLDFIELLSISTSSGELLNFKINPIRNSLEIEKINIFKDIFGLFVNEFFYILVTIDGIFVHDTLTNRIINKCSYPKYFLKYENEDEQILHDHHSQNHLNSRVKISKLEGNKFLLIWGKSLAQIWDFNPRTSSSSSSKQSRTTNIDRGLIGNKAIRKYSKYAVNTGIEDYKDEKLEEDHLNHLRQNLNIEGLTEEELISYAKLVSKEGDAAVGLDVSLDVSLDASLVDDFVTSNDPDLEMALKLSLIEM